MAETVWTVPLSTRNIKLGGTIPQISKIIIFVVTKEDLFLISLHKNSKFLVFWGFFSAFSANREVDNIVWTSLMLVLLSGTTSLIKKPALGHCSLLHLLVFKELQSWILLFLQKH